MNFGSKSSLMEPDSRLEDVQPVDHNPSNDELVYHMEQKYFAKVEPAILMDESVQIFESSAISTLGLRLLVLNNLQISRIGDLNRFKKLAQNVRELDLGWNEISSWSVISDLLKALPLLRVLNISHNSLESNPHLVIPPTRLTSLILNGTNISLATVRALVSPMKSLRELHLSSNPRTFVTSHNPELSSENMQPISTSVSTIHLNECGLSDWSAVLKVLRLFPNTVNLFLAQNPLKSIERECPESGLQTSQITMSIRSIVLSGTQLNSWEAIDNLGCFVGNGSLEELRCTQIPLLETYAEETYRHLTTARIPSLRSFNGSTIGPSQRKESERFFIRFYQSFVEKPPIYEHLVAKHGMLEQKQVEKCNLLTGIRSRKIRLVYCDKSLERDLSTAISIHKIVGLAARLFGFDPDTLQGVELRRKMPGYRPERLPRTKDNLLRQFDLEDGDTIAFI